MLMQSATLTHYEKRRVDRMKENEEALASLGIKSLVGSLRNNAAQNNQEKSKDCEDRSTF